MTSFKKFTFVVAMAAIVVLASTTQAQTTTPPPLPIPTTQLQNAQGGTAIWFQGQNGDTLNGGDTYGGVKADYTASDPNSAT